MNLLLLIKPSRQKASRQFLRFRLDLFEVKQYSGARVGRDLILVAYHEMAEF
jgi:hypothetical protein